MFLPFRISDTYVSIYFEFHTDFVHKTQIDYQSSLTRPVCWLTIFMAVQRWPPLWLPWLVF